MSFIMSRRISRSFSPVAQSMASTGRPHASFFAGSSVMRLAWLGSISPNAVRADAPRARRGHLVLERAADAEFGHRALPALAVGAALIAEAAQVRRASRRPGCGSAGCRSRWAGRRRRCDPRTRARRRWRRSGSGGPSGCGRARPSCCPGRRARRRSPTACSSHVELSVEAQRKTTFAAVDRRLFRVGVEHAHAGGALAVLVVDHVGDDGVHLERQPAGGHRRRQRRGLRAEVGAVGAAETAGVAVLAAPALAERLREVGDAARDDAPRAAEVLRQPAGDAPVSATLSGMAGWNWPSGSCGRPSTRSARCRRDVRRGRTTARCRRSGSASRRRCPPSRWPRSRGRCGGSSDGPT